MVFSENKFYDRKESLLTKYHCIRSKLTAKNFLRSPLRFTNIRLLLWAPRGRKFTASFISTVILQIAPLSFGNQVLA